ncbi:MAG: hypothetical protein V7609_2071 [Verrucomicrobiota bacterium]
MSFATFIAILFAGVLLTLLLGFVRLRFGRPALAVIILPILLAIADVTHDWIYFVLTWHGWGRLPWSNLSLLAVIALVLGSAISGLLDHPRAGDNK